MKKLKIGVESVGAKAYSKEIENMSQSSNASSTSSLKTRFVPIDETDFNWDSIVIEPPKKKGNYSYSNLVVVDDDGEPKNLAFQLADQNIYGLKYNNGPENKKPQSGIKFTYLLRDEETESRFDTIIDKVARAIEAFYNDETISKKMPKLGKIQLDTMADGKTIDLIKPSYTTNENGNTCVYPEFNTSGRGHTLKNYTSFRGRKKDEKWTDYLQTSVDDDSTKACATVSLRIKGISFGACGTGMSCIANVKYVVQAIKLSKPMEEEKVEEEDVFAYMSDEEDPEEEGEENTDEVASTEEESPTPEVSYKELLAKKANATKGKKKK